MGEKGDIKGLIKKLEGKDMDARVEAGAALIKIGEPAVEPLIQAMDDEEYSFLLLFTAIYDKEGFAAKPTIETLSAGTLEIQKSLAAILTAIGEPAIEPMIRALQDSGKTKKLRCRLANMLGKTGDKRAIEPLAKAAQSEDVWIRTAAKSALEELRGKV